MNSKRFTRPVLITQHARARMAERNISEAMLLEVIDTGETRYRDETQIYGHISRFLSVRTTVFSNPGMGLKLA